MTTGTGAARPLLQIVIPARNEAARLPRGLDVLCHKLAALPFLTEIIVVDNASTDGTARVVLDRGTDTVPVRLIRCDRPGKGAAVRAGLLATTASFVGYVDADMATGLGALDQVMSLLGAGRGVVLGSRSHPGSTVQSRRRPVRRLGAVVFSRLGRGLAGGVHDTQCGFKFFAGPVARAAAAELRTAGFAFDVELLLHCRRLGHLPYAIPVEWRDVPGSTFSVSRHSLGCVRDLLEIMARAWLTRPTMIAEPQPVLVGLQSP
jgi:glycosyltransferase involved in cell wall biosynthesis